MFTEERLKISIALSVVIVLCVFALLAFNNENAINKGRLHVHKPVVFPEGTPDLEKHTLVFFGYVGCPTVCTPRLQEITEIYKDFVEKSQTDKLSVLFINLQSTMSTQEADVYAKSFHPEFKGVTYEKQSLLTTLRMFQAYYSHSLLDSDEIEHTQFLYFVHKGTSDNYYLNNIYINTPYDKDTVVNDLIKDLE